MATLDWHAERADLCDLQLLDQAPESLGIDLRAVRLYRMAGVRAEMRKRDIAALVISDPVNIRYATGARNRQIFCARNTPARYLILSEHRNILFEFTGCEHLAAGLETVDEVRPSTAASFVAAGPAIAVALFESLLMNHPFVDGNKPVAFFATDVFLRLNGFRIDVEPEPAHVFLVGLLEDGERDFDHLLPWLHDRALRM